MEALELVSNFQSVMPSIRHQIDSTASQRIQKKQRSIIDIVILCRQQGIPLRGHQDDHTSLISKIMATFQSC